MPECWESGCCQCCCQGRNCCLKVLPELWLSSGAGAWLWTPATRQVRDRTAWAMVGMEVPGAVWAGTRHDQAVFSFQRSSYLPSCHLLLCLLPLHAPLLQLKAISSLWLLGSCLCAQLLCEANTGEAFPREAATEIRRCENKACQLHEQALSGCPK